MAAGLIQSSNSWEFWARRVKWISLACWCDLGKIGKSVVGWKMDV